MADFFPPLAEASGDGPVILQCGTRRVSTSAEVAHYLIQQGYSRVYNLEGGTFGWMMNGNEVIRPGVAAETER